MSQEKKEQERPFIRPSSLQMAEICSRSPWLGHKYKEETDQIRKGNDVDADVSIALVGGGEPKTKAGAQLVEWVRRRFGPTATFYVQRKVRLLDPETGELITRGTADLIVVVGKRVYVVDWKKKGQMWGGYVAPADENLQQQAYGIAAAMEFGAEEFQVVLAFFDDRGITPEESRVLAGVDWWSLIGRIKSIPPVDFDGPEPMAVKGEHCDRCWEKTHCSAYLLPAMQEMPEALVPFSEANTAVALSHDEALAGLEWLEQADEVMKRASKIRKLVLSQLETFAVTVGPIRKGDHEWGPHPTSGKRSGPTVGELEDLGLHNLIKPGTPGVKFDWKKIA